MKYSGLAAAGTLALVLGGAGAVDAGSGGFDGSPYVSGGDGAGFGIVEVGGGHRHRDEWRHGHRHGGHGHYDRGYHHRDHGHHRWHGDRHSYSRGYPHHHFGYPYYDSRARYFQPYGHYGHGYRSRRDCY